MLRLVDELVRRRAGWRTPGHVEQGPRWLRTDLSRTTGPAQKSQQPEAMPGVAAARSMPRETVKPRFKAAVCVREARTCRT